LSRRMGRWWWHCSFGADSHTRPKCTTPVSITHTYMQRVTTTTKVHHARVNHPHVHAARYNHGEQGARVSTRRRKGVDAWPTRSGRRPSADTTTAQTLHELTNTQPKRQCTPLNRHTHTHDGCEFMATAGSTVHRCINTYQNRGLIRHWKVCHLGCACVCVSVCSMWRLCLWPPLRGGTCKLHDKTWKVFFPLQHRPDAHATRCLSPHSSPLRADRSRELVSVSTFTTRGVVAMCKRLRRNVFPLPLPHLSAE
jgi:hypothetical protein